MIFFVDYTVTKEYQGRHPVDADSPRDAEEKILKAAPSDLIASAGESFTKVSARSEGIFTLPKMEES